MDYTITVNDTEKKALEFCAVDVDDYLTNFATNRARIAKNQIIKKLVEHCNSNGIALAVGEDAQVTQAYTLGVVKTLKAETDEYMANLPGMSS